MKNFKIFINIWAICLISTLFTTPAIGETSGVAGSLFPGTCAEKMADVPKGDASWDKSESGKSYVTAQSYQDAVKNWKTTNLVPVTIANVDKDHLGLPIFVHKDAATAFTNFGKDLLNCEEIKQGIYSIEIFDNFACRVITDGKTLSPHASGLALDINVKTNNYTETSCKATDCDFSPCFLAALKKNGLSWGGPGDPILFPGKCDTQHIQWTNNKTNVRESDLTFCALNQNIAKLYSAGTTLSTGAVVKSITVDTGIPLINEVELILGKPQTKIELPGLNFSDIQAVEEDGGKYLYIPFFGEYIASIYKYGVIITSILAVVMIINAGFSWVISGGEQEKINHSKKRIIQAIVGLFLAVSSYTMLYMINPNLVSFRSLRVPYIEGEPLTEMENINLIFGVDGGVPTDFGNLQSDFSNITSGGYYNTMMQSCGDGAGFKLGSIQARQARLKEILKTWKKSSVDNGGAMYVLGGSLSCKPKKDTNPLYALGYLAVVANQSPGSIPMQMLDALGQIKLTNGSSCRNVFDKAVIIQKTKKNLTNVRKNSAAEAVAEILKIDKSQAESGVKPCTSVYGAIYSHLSADFGRAAGMVCGDCGRYLLYMYSGCFDKRPEIGKQYGYTYIRPTTKCGSGSLPSSFFLKVKNSDFSSQEKIASLESQLQFGDIIRMEGHFLMYTGKSGDPQINYELIEMGGYTTSQMQSGETVIKKKYGLKYSFSSVNVHSSFKNYFKKNIYGLHKSAYTCFSRPLDPKYIPAN